MHVPPNQPQHLLCLAEAVGIGEKAASRKKLNPSEATENGEIRILALRGVSW